MEIKNSATYVVVVGFMLFIVGLSVKTVSVAMPLFQMLHR